MPFTLKELLWPTTKRRLVKIEFDSNVTDKKFIMDTLNYSWENTHTFQEANSEEDADVRIAMSQPKEMPPGFEGFSVYIPPDQIQFNTTNWTSLPEGYTHNRRSPTLEKYRKHLINHEMAHFFGFGHGTCDITEQPTVKSVCHKPPYPFDVPILITSQTDP